MRKRTHRRVYAALPPPGLRPRLETSQVQDLGLVHIGNLDALARGAGSEELLWQYAGGAFTWSRVANVLMLRNPDAYREAAAAMARQLQVVTAMLERFRRTGRVGFTGPEYQVAKDACEWMDALAENVDLHTAVMAADWSEQQISLGQARPRQEQAA